MVLNSYWWFGMHGHLHGHLTMGSSDLSLLGPSSLTEVHFQNVCDSPQTAQCIVAFASSIPSTSEILLAHMPNEQGCFSYDMDIPQSLVRKPEQYS